VTKEKPILSIIITSYAVNRFKDIRELFDSIKSQTILTQPKTSQSKDAEHRRWNVEHSFEVIFVADQSEELAERAACYLKRIGIPRFKIILNKGKMGVNVCRNIGIKASSGEIVGIVDDDVILFPDWAERMIKSYQDDSEVVGVTGPAVPLWEEPESMSWFPKELYFVWGCTVWDWDEKREIRNVGGMNCSFIKKALVQAGFYNPFLGPRSGGARLGKWFYVGAEEIDMSLRIKKITGGKIIYNPEVKVYHKVRKEDFSLNLVVKRCLHFGYTKAFINKHYKDFSSEQILQLEHKHLKYILTSSLIKYWKETVKCPSVAVKKLTTLILGVFFTGLGYLTYYLCYTLRADIVSKYGFMWLKTPK
jgi:glycosyltransferase involved in cell wall biosynthesis